MGWGLNVWSAWFLILTHIALHQMEKALKGLSPVLIVVQLGPVEHVPSSSGQGLAIVRP